MTDDERDRQRVDDAIQSTQALLDQGPLIRASMTAVREKLHDTLTVIVQTEIDMAAMIEKQNRRPKT